MSIHDNRTDRARWRSERRRLLSAAFSMDGKPVPVNTAKQGEADILSDLERHGALVLSIVPDNIQPERSTIYARLGPNASLYLLALRILSRADNREAVDGVVTLDLSAAEVASLERAIYGEKP